MVEDIDLEKLREQIEKKGLKALDHFFDTEIDKINFDHLRMIYNKARLGMQFEKEINLNRRSYNINIIRLMKLLNLNRDEILEVMKSSMPYYYEKFVKV